MATKGSTLNTPKVIRLQAMKKCMIFTLIIVNELWIARGLSFEVLMFSWLENLRILMLVNFEESFGWLKNLGIFYLGKFWGKLWLIWEPNDFYLGKFWGKLWLIWELEDFYIAKFEVSLVDLRTWGFLYC
jgi:hypothetical protein